MKKIITLVLILAMCMSVMAGCAQEKKQEASGIAAAKEYLATMYRDFPASHAKDYEVVGKIVIGDKEYKITWTADSDTVKFTEAENGMVIVDITEGNAEEVVYKLTAALEDGEGGAETVAFEQKVPADISKLTSAELAEAAYKLKEGEAMPSAAVLVGVVSGINDPYSEKYKNITLTIVADGLNDKPIQCFRLTGDGADALKEGDKIGVVGMIKNYKGTVEFDKGCRLIPADMYDAAKAVVAAYALAEGAAMPDPVTLTGVIVSVDDEFNPKYGNVTVTIVVGGLEDYKIQCFRLSGEGADKIKTGDTVTVTGIIKNYKGTVEFDKGCTLNPAA